MSGSSGDELLDIAWERKVADEGEKKAAVIDLKTHKALWEDIAYVLVSRSLRQERGVPLEKVKAGLIASGKLRG